MADQAIEPTELVGSDYPLAIVTPSIGAPSETFIRRHAHELLPGRTVVVANRASPHGVYWTPDGPALMLGIPRRVPTRVGRAIHRRLPLPDTSRRQAKQFLRTHGVEVVLAHYLDAAIHWIETAVAVGAAFYVRAHGFDISARLLDPAWRRAYLRYQRAQAVITPSELSRRRLIELGLDPLKIHVLPSGVDVPRVCPRPAEVGSESTVRCLAVGRFVPKKAPLLTLQAFLEAAAQRPDLRLDFVGDGPLRTTAEDYVRSHRLGARVTLHGALPSNAVSRLREKAHMFLQHSVVDPDTGDEEGLPVAILEAMSQGLPVVSTLHAGIPEAVIDASTGYLVAEGDVSGMSERIVELGESPELRREFGAAGWERARDSFSWAQERDALLRLMRLA